jgi:hypothetical protein
MFGIGNRHHTYRELPEPPYSLDLIADLHAGVYPAHLADALRQKVFADPASAAIWNALDATTGELAAVPIVDEELPAFAEEKLDQTLRSILENHAEPEPASVTPLRRRRPGRVLPSVAAVAAAVAAIAVAATFAFGGRSTPPPVAQPAPTTIAAPSDATLLSALGHSDAAAFPDTARRDRCLAANNVAPTTPVLGTASIETGGGPAVVILLSTGTAGQFDALVVGTDCDTTSPATLSRTVIGNK